MNRCRRSGESSPTGIPFLVTTNDSPWSSWRIMSPLLLRSSRWVICLATPKCSTRATAVPSTVRITSNGRRRRAPGVGRRLGPRRTLPSWVSTSRPVPRGCTPYVVWSKPKPATRCCRRIYSTDLSTTPFGATRRGFPPVCRMCEVSSTVSQKCCRPLLSGRLGYQAARRLRRSSGTAGRCLGR